MGTVDRNPHDQHPGDRRAHDPHAGDRHPDDQHPDERDRRRRFGVGLLVAVAMFSGSCGDGSGGGATGYLVPDVCADRSATGTCA